MRTANASKSIYQLVQAVLSSHPSVDTPVTKVFDDLTPDQLLVVWVALNAVNQQGGINDLNKSLKASGHHFSQVNMLRVKKIIGRKDKDEPWTLTKSTIKKLSKLADGGDSAGPVETTTPAEAEAPARRKALTLDKASLTEIGSHVVGRLSGIDEQIEQIRRESEERISALQAERLEFVEQIKKLAGEVS